MQMNDGPFWRNQRKNNGGYICSGLNVYATYYFIRSAAQKDSGGCRQQRHEHCPLFASALRSWTMNFLREEKEAPHARQ